MLHPGIDCLDVAASSRSIDDILYGYNRGQQGAKLDSTLAAPHQHDPIFDARIVDSSCHKSFVRLGFCSKVSRLPRIQ